MPKKVLISNCAHLGDILITMQVVARAKKIFNLNNISITLVAGTWAKDLVNSFEIFDNYYYLDHWRHNRSEEGIISKIKTYLRQKKTLRQKLKSDHYDVFLQMNSYWYDSLPIAYKANIRRRYGYPHIGLNKMLTNTLSFSAKNASEFMFQNEIMNTFLSDCLIRSQINKGFDFYNITQYLKPKKLNNQIKDLISMKDKIAIISLGRGIRERSWPRERWHILVQNLIKDDFQVLIVGNGDREDKIAKSLLESVCNSGLISLVNRTSLSDLIYLVTQSQIVVSVETFVGHLAASLGIRVVSIYSGVSDVARWAPRGENTSLLIEDLDCISCGIKNGCESLSCINNVGVNEVFKECLNK